MKHLTVVFVLALISQIALSGEHSVFVGLHVEHLVSGKYTEYRDEPKPTGELRDGFWISVYQDKDLNDGFTQNNQLFGYRYAADNFSVSVLTYKNSFFERSFGLTFNKLHRFTSKLTVEYGAIIVTGYRKALVNDNKNDSMDQTPMIVPMASMSYIVFGDTALTYTNMAMGVGIMALEIKI